MAPAGFFLQAPIRRTQEASVTMIRICISFDNRAISRTYESRKFGNPITSRPRQYSPPGAARRLTTLASLLLFLHGAEAAIVGLQPDQFRERSDILIPWHLAARDFFHLQGSNPIVGDAIERYESALGQSRDIGFGREHACGLHAGAGRKNGCSCAFDAGDVTQMRNRGRVQL